MKKNAKKKERALGATGVGQREIRKNTLTTSQEIFLEALNPQQHVERNVRNLKQHLKLIFLSFLS